MPPTPRRLAEARRQGIVPRSPDLSAVLGALGSVVALGLAGPALADGLVKLTAAMLQSPDPLSLGDVAASSAGLVATAGMLLAALAGVAVLANVAQVGFMVSAEPLALDFSRLSGGLRGALGPRGLVRVAMAVGKLAVVAGVGYWSIRSTLPRLTEFVSASPAQMLAWSARAVCRLWSALAGSLLVLAVVDWLYQRWQHRQDLRMTRQEWIEDLRRTEGDGRVKAYRRQMTAPAGAQRLATQMPKAQAVIYSPGGAAVAVGGGVAGEAIRVVACGQGVAGRRIRLQGRRQGVVAVEDARLAGQLLRRCKIRQDVPQKLYARVAEVVAYAQALSKDMEVRD